jgi:hypothetical protein
VKSTARFSEPEVDGKRNLKLEPTEFLGIFIKDSETVNEVPPRHSHSV